MMVILNSVSAMPTAVFVAIQVRVMTVMFALTRVKSHLKRLNLVQKKGSV